MQKWRNLLKIQLLASSALTILFTCVYPSFFRDPDIRILNQYNSVIIFSSLMIAYVLLYGAEHKQNVERVSQIFNIIFLPYILSEIYLISFKFLFRTFPNFDFILGIIRIIGFTLIFIPVTIASWSKVQNVFLRLLTIEIVGFNSMLVNYPLFESNQIIFELERSFLVYAFQFLIFVYFELKGWGLKLRFNIKQKWAMGLIITTIFLMIFSMWYNFFSSYNQISPDLAGSV